MANLLSIAYIVLLLLVFYLYNRKYAKEISAFTFPLVYLIKLGFSGLFIYIYSFYYGEGKLIFDAGNYFDDSQILHDVFYRSPRDFFKLFISYKEDIALTQYYLNDTTQWLGGEHFLINDTRNIVRVNTLIHFISRGTVFIHFIVFSFFSLWGGIELYQWLKKKTTIPYYLLILLLTLVPSIAFWGSSIIKEPLLILGVALYLRGQFDKLSIKQKTWRMILGGLLVIAFKPYIFVCLLVASGFYILSKFLNSNKKAIIIYGLSCVVFLLFFGQKTTDIISDKQADFINVGNGGLYIARNDNYLYYIKLEDIDSHFSIDEEEEYAVLTESVDAFYLKPNEKLERYPIKIEEVGDTFKIYLNLIGAKSMIHVTPIKNSFSQLILNIPEALYNTHIEPIPKKGNSPIQLWSFFENLFFIFLLILLLLKPKKLSLEDKGILLALGCFIILSSLIIGWTATISGAIVRYMVPIHLAIIVFFIIGIDFKFDRIPFLRKKNQKV